MGSRKGSTPDWCWWQWLLVLMTTIMCCAGCDGQHGRGPDPTAEIQLLDRPPWRLSDLPCQRLVVNYWASWCAHCRKEIPELNRFAQQHPEVCVVAVNFDGGNAASLNDEARAFHIAFPHAAADPAPQLGITTVPAVPVTYVFDRQLRRLHTLFGPQAQSSLWRAVRSG